MNSGLDDWDSHWQQYADAARENPAQVYRHTLLLELLRERRPAGDWTLIDFGSGQGDFLQRMAQASPQARLIGFELSASGVEITRRKVPAADVRQVDLLAAGDEEDLAGCADLAVCSEVLEHLDDPRALLARMRPYLKPGAELLVTVPGGPMSAFDRLIGHRRHFTPESLAVLAGESGWELWQVFRAGFPFFNLYRLVVILRGRALSEDVRADRAGGTSGVARLVMKIFSLLFRGNLRASPFGWQMVAVLRRPDAVSAVAGTTGTGR